MKKLLLNAVLLIVIIGCSSQRGIESSGKCLVCGKPTAWKSIGYCDKHYTLEKEQVLRGVIASH